MESPKATSPNTPLWRQRKLAAEANDYQDRLLSPKRLSPYRSLSPNRSRKNSNSNNECSWADQVNELDEETDMMLERSERALGGLNQYQKNMSDFNKENISPVRSNNNFKNSNSQHPRYGQRKITVETDSNVLIRRQKDIDYGKNQEIYAEYLCSVDKHNRTNQQPWTPDKYEKMTRRNWDKQIKIWRKQLHHWQNPLPTSQLLTPGTSPCPSPNRRLSPPREFADTPEIMKKDLRKSLMEDFQDDNAMTGFGPSDGFVSENAKNENARRANFNVSENMDDSMNSNSCSQNMVVSQEAVPMMFR